MRHPLRARLARKLLLAVGLPTLALSLAGVVWLRHETREVAPRLWGFVLAFLLVLTVAVSAVHLLAVHLVVERPLARLLASLRRAERGEFLVRVPEEGDDELGELARGLNTALAAITDLHVRRIDDARELALKAELERQHGLLDEAHRRLERRVGELTLLAELGRTLSGSLRLEDLLRFLADAIGPRLGVDAFAILLRDEARGDLAVEAAFGVEPAAQEARVPLGAGTAGEAAARGERVLIRDTRGDARFPVERWTGGRHGSVLAVPMMAQGGCVGVLDFFRPVPDAFSDDEVRLLEAVASQAALAIANARLHERAVALSLTDALTGVHNRRSLFARLELELARAERFGNACAVVMIDVDHFRHLNDAHGHLAGDATLRRVAELLGGAVRRIDTLARYGGEEFALVLPRADRRAALEAAEKLRARVAGTAFEHGATQPGGRVTISLGVAAFPDDARELPALVDCADAALYAAKKRGRDGVVAYAPGMRESPGRKRDVRVTAAAEPGQAG